MIGVTRCPPCRGTGEVGVLTPGQFVPPELVGVPMIVPPSTAREICRKHPCLVGLLLVKYIHRTCCPDCGGTGRAPVVVQGAA